MKIINLIFAFNLIADICLSQTTLVPVTFIIEDFDSHKEIVAALVTVRQTALTQPTLANGKVRFENVPVGEIEYYISKEGYQFETGRVNVSSDIKTNNFRIPISKLDDKKILVTGEVTDSEGRDLKDAWVEVKIADQVRTVMSDASGNYSLDIAPSTKFPTSTMRIEVKKGNCKKTETVDIPRTNVVYKDIKLECNSSGSVEDKPESNGGKSSSNFVEQSIRKNNMVYKITNCKQLGQEIECYFDVKSENKDDLLMILGHYERNSKIIDADTGFEYYCNSITIADLTDDKRVDKKVVAGITVKVRLSFSGVNTKLRTLGMVELHCGSGSAGWYQVEFRDVLVK